MRTVNVMLLSFLYPLVVLLTATVLPTKLALTDSVEIHVIVARTVLVLSKIIDPFALVKKVSKATLTSLATLSDVAPTPNVTPEKLV